MAKNVKEVCDRKVLGEGRNNGMGFAMLKKVDEENFVTVNPISPCKDYLAEVIFTENTGIPTSGCGLQYPKKLDILQEPMSYMVFVNQKTKQGTFSTEGKTFEQYSKEIKDGHKRIEAFINRFQKKFRNYKPCTVEEVNDGQFLITFDTRWAQSPYSISLFTLLLRTAKDYAGGTVLNHLLSIPKTCVDYSLITTAFKRILIITEKRKLPGIPAAHIKAAKSGGWSPHHNGICAWDEKFE